VVTTDLENEGSGEGRKASAGGMHDEVMMEKNDSQVVAESDVPQA
jgi:hypothetical protein